MVSLERFYCTKQNFFEDTSFVFEFHIDIDIDRTKSFEIYHEGKYNIDCFSFFFYKMYCSFCYHR